MTIKWRTRIEMIGMMCLTMILLLSLGLQSVNTLVVNRTLELLVKRDMDEGMNMFIQYSPAPALPLNLLMLYNMEAMDEMNELVVLSILEGDKKEELQTTAMKYAQSRIEFYNFSAFSSSTYSTMRTNAKAYLTLVSSDDVRDLKVYEPFYDSLVQMNVKIGWLKVASVICILIHLGCIVWFGQMIVDFVKRFPRVKPNK